VVDSHQGAVRPADLTAGILQTLKGLRRGHLVDKVAIYSCVSDNCSTPMQARAGVIRHTDVQQAGAVLLLIDDVVIEDLIVQGPRL
jgi:hypothetical protein